MNLEPNELYSRIHELMTRQLNDDADSNAAAELAQLLRDSARARQVYVEYMNETVDLGWWSAFGLTNGKERTPSRLADLDSFPRSGTASRAQALVCTRSVLFYATVASMLLATGLASVWWYRGSNQHERARIAQGNSHPQTIATSSSVATLVRITDAVWLPSSPVPADFSRLEVGHSLALDRGQVELVFDTGVEVVARGPCRIRITSASSIYADEGSILARVGKTGRGFRIDTPTSQLLDLGTKFGVDISPSGITDVAVFDGMVDLTSDHSGLDHPDRLFQGDAVQVLNSGQTNRLVAFDSFKFPVAGGQRRDAAMRQPIITSVSDNIDEGTFRKAYRINRDGFREDCPAFVDREHEWNGVDQQGLPRELVGADYVMPFNDDKFAQDIEIHLETCRPAIIYVIISNSVIVPDWLMSKFEKTGLAVGLDEGPFSWEPQQTVDVGPGKSIDTLFSVWRRVVSEPGTLTLGGVAPLPDTFEGYNMYGIVATELNDDPAGMPQTD